MNLVSGVLLLFQMQTPIRGIKYRHAWNVIRIDGKYYHLDVTFDNTLSRDDAVRYDYVNLADKQIFKGP